jgi:hypothetical protein
MRTSTFVLAARNRSVAASFQSLFQCCGAAKSGMCARGFDYASCIMRRRRTIVIKLRGQEWPLIPVRSEKERPLPGG